MDIIPAFDVMTKELPATWKTVDTQSDVKVAVFSDESYVATDAWYDFMTAALQKKPLTVEAASKLSKVDTLLRESFTKLTPLAAAVHFGACVDVVTTLISVGCGSLISHPTRPSESPLHIACAKREPAVIEALVGTKDVVALQRTYCGVASPLEMFLQRSDATQLLPELLTIFNNAAPNGALDIEYVHSLCDRKQLGVLAAPAAWAPLLASGKLRLSGGEAGNLIHSAACCKDFHPALVEMIRTGTDMSISQTLNYKGETALHVAVNANNEAGVGTLVSAAPSQALVANHLNELPLTLALDRKRSEEMRRKLEDVTLSKITTLHDQPAVIDRLATIAIVRQRFELAVKLLEVLKSIASPASDALRAAIARRGTMDFIKAHFVNLVGAGAAAKFVPGEGNMVTIALRCEKYEVARFLLDLVIKQVNVVEETVNPGRYGKETTDANHHLLHAVLRSGQVDLIEQIAAKAPAPPERYGGLWCSPEFVHLVGKYADKFTEINEYHTANTPLLDKDSDSFWGAWITSRGMATLTRMGKPELVNDIAPQLQAQPFSLIVISKVFYRFQRVMEETVRRIETVTANDMYELSDYFKSMRKPFASSVLCQALEKWSGPNPEELETYSEVWGDRVMRPAVKLIAKALPDYKKLSEFLKFMELDYVFSEVCKSPPSDNVTDDNLAFLIGDMSDDRGMLRDFMLTALKQGKRKSTVAALKVLCTPPVPKEVVGEEEEDDDSYSYTPPAGPIPPYVRRFSMNETKRQRNTREDWEALRQATHQAVSGGLDYFGHYLAIRCIQLGVSDEFLAKLCTEVGHPLAQHLAIVASAFPERSSLLRGVVTAHNSSEPLSIAPLNDGAIDVLCTAKDGTVTIPKEIAMIVDKHAPGKPNISGPEAVSPFLAALTSEEVSSQSFKSLVQKFKEQMSEGIPKFDFDRFRDKFWALHVFSPLILPTHVTTRSALSIVSNPHRVRKGWDLLSDKCAVLASFEEITHNEAAVDFLVPQACRYGWWDLLKTVSASYYSGPTKTLSEEETQEYEIDQPVVLHSTYLKHRLCLEAPQDVLSAVLGMQNDGISRRLPGVFGKDKDLLWAMLRRPDAEGALLSTVINWYGKDKVAKDGISFIKYLLVIGASIDRIRSMMSEFGIEVSSLTTSTWSACAFAGRIALAENSEDVLGVLKSAPPHGIVTYLCQQMRSEVHCDASDALFNMIEGPETWMNLLSTSPGVPFGVDILSSAAMCKTTKWMRKLLTDPAVTPLSEERYLAACRAVFDVTRPSRYEEFLTLLLELKNSSEELASFDINNHPNGAYWSGDCADDDDGEPAETGPAPNTGNWRSEFQVARAPNLLPDVDAVPTYLRIQALVAEVCGTVPRDVLISKEQLQRWLEESSEDAVKSAFTPAVLKYTDLAIDIIPMVCDKPGLLDIVCEAAKVDAARMAKSIKVFGNLAKPSTFIPVFDVLKQHLPFEEIGEVARAVGDQAFVDWHTAQQQ